MSNNPLAGKATKGGDFQSSELAPAGNKVAVCVAIIDLGTHEQNAYKGQPRKPARMVYIAWELCNCVKSGSKLRHVVYSRYPLFFTEKAGLRKMLESWRGAKYPEGAEIHLDKVLGRGCAINVSHETAGERTYARIAGVAPLPEGFKAPGPTYAPFFWYIGCGQPIPKHDWLPWCYGSSVEDLIKQSPEWQALGGAATQAAQADEVEQGHGEADAEGEGEIEADEPVMAGPPTGEDCPF